MHSSISGICVTSIPIFAKSNLIYDYVYSTTEEVDLKILSGKTVSLEDNFFS